MTMLKAVGAEFNTMMEVDAYLIEGGSLAPSTTQKRGGAYSFGGLSNNSTLKNWLQVNVPIPLAEIYPQFCFWINALPTLASDPGLDSKINRILGWYGASGIMGSLEIGTDGLLKLYSGNSATLLGTSSNSVPIQSWFVIELHLKIHDTTGIATLRLNGAEEITFAGDTKSTDDSEISYFRPNWPGAVFGFGDQFVDDIIFNDLNGSVNNSWPNGLKIALLKPTADGNHKEWTPSTGSDNYALVDELPPVIADFLAAGSNGLRDTYVMEDCPEGMGPIAAVIPSYWGQKSGTPACENLKRLMRIGGSDYAGANLAVPTSFSLIQEVLETSPATSNPFTVSEMNGMEFGQQSAT